MAQADTAPTLQSLAIDEDGFLLDPEAWNRQLAASMAVHDGLLLSDDHWDLIQSLRDFYFTHGYAPQERHVCHLTQRDKFCIDKMFHDHYREAWRLAGLPNPGEEYKSYM